MVFVCTLKIKLLCFSGTLDVSEENANFFQLGADPVVKTCNFLQTVFVHTHSNINV